MDYDYKLLFEDRTISLLTYNLETLLAEKYQTILARGIANTRLRDFYDVYELTCKHGETINPLTMRQAFAATCRKRQTIFERQDAKEILSAIWSDEGLSAMWSRYKEKNYYVENLAWEDVIAAASKAIIKCFD